MKLTLNITQYAFSADNEGTNKIKEINIRSRNRPFAIIATHHRGSCPMLI
jgi:hypothetical protein